MRRGDIDSIQSVYILYSCARFCVPHTPLLSLRSSFCSALTIGCCLPGTLYRCFHHKQTRRIVGSLWLVM